MESIASDQLLMLSVNKLQAFDLAPIVQMFKFFNYGNYFINNSTFDIKKKCLKITARERLYIKA